jgi:hypothetical protein
LVLGLIKKLREKKGRKKVVNPSGGASYIAYNNNIRL